MFSIIQAAGWPIWLLLIASIVAVALIIERVHDLARRKILPPGCSTKSSRSTATASSRPEMVQRVGTLSPLGRILARRCATSSSRAR